MTGWNFTSEVHGEKNERVDSRAIGRVTDGANTGPVVDQWPTRVFTPQWIDYAEITLTSQRDQQRFTRLGPTFKTKWTNLGIQWKPGQWCVT